MKRIALLAMVAVISFSAVSYAQQNAAWNLLESPFKLEAEVSNVGETVTCTLLLGGGTASLFGLDKALGTTPQEFLGNELVGSYRVFQFDETCLSIATWPTSFTGPTMTGITLQEPSQIVYWGVDPFGAGTIDDYVKGTGAPGPAPSVPLAAGFPGVWGPLAINNNTAGTKAFCEDIAADLALEYDLITGAVGGSIGNPDNASGLGAYGNGISDAVDPGFCSGAGMVMSSGTVAEGQVARASQVDSLGTLCYGTWDLDTPLSVPYGETFVNGIEEFVSAIGLDRRMMALGNITGIAFNLGQPVGISDCQGQDAPDSDLVFVNSSQGGSTYTVGVNNTTPLGMAIQKPAAGGNGKYITTLNSGIPSSGTVTSLPAGLGSFCFPLLIPPFGSAAPASVWNNIGKTEKVGASNYFGTPIVNPDKAPAYFVSNAAGDPVNFPLSSQWTLQGIIINPAGSSPKAASVTNAVIVDVTAGI